MTATPADKAINQHIGSRIRTRRTLMRMSQQKLAEAIGLTFQQVQKYETGANSVSAARLHQIAEILDAPVSFFFDDFGSSKGAPTLQNAVALGDVETAAKIGGLPTGIRRAMGALTSALASATAPNHA
jgi:transcriptional regulator with XRE-family HTH domain